MTTPIRPQRLLPRLSAATRPTTTTRACILDQKITMTNQSRRQSTNIPHLPRSHNNKFTTQQRRLASNTTETITIPSPDITNHYTIFPQTLPAGPPPHAPFEISPSDLRREFLQLQNTIHPDKYPPGPKKQKAEALSARINEAYRTLLDPLSRAQYLLLEMHDIDVTAEDGAAHHALDPETLMEVMEVQETIEEVGSEPDAEKTIAELKEQNDLRLGECVRALAEAFDEGDVEKARKECIRLRFWYNVSMGLREWEPGTTQIRLVH
ncbi:HSCB C-terminal oligomerization domain-containing protein [Aspergillus avenaceus]|uniref:HSCB C-terminal oligomerization domain-containing protein n=1 Tax=Aspergillus avenaceus TaxID=36643 RepID=A0A5N6TG65_ASPAV|nr:HSCB C-terminal oligomerization domain-containing protein [Aspergillus avenaceus]